MGFPQNPSYVIQSVKVQDYINIFLLCKGYFSFMSPKDLMGLKGCLDLYKLWLRNLLESAATLEIQHVVHNSTVLEIPITKLYIYWPCHITSQFWLWHNINWWWTLVLSSLLIKHNINWWHSLVLSSLNAYFHWCYPPGSVATASSSAFPLPLSSTYAIFHLSLCFFGLVHHSWGSTLKTEWPVAFQVWCRHTWNAVGHAFTSSAVFDDICCTCDTLHNH